MDPRTLREETRSEHEATEALLPLTDPHVTCETYIHALEKLFPLLSSWEVWASANAPEQLRSMLSKRSRSAMLLADLHVFAGRVRQDATTAVDWSPVLKDLGSYATKDMYRAAYIGALYVVEGSSLGGRIIARHIQAALQLKSEEGLSYFLGYGDATGSRWREVVAEISDTPDELAPIVINAAKHAFRIFGQNLNCG